MAAEKAKNRRENMIYTFENKKPVIAKNAFIAETACIIGNVTIGEKTSVWFNSVIRGDRAKISIGKGCNIQDNVVIHSDERDVEIGDGVTIGHGSVMHGCTVKNNALIGMNATVLHGAEIGEYVIVGAGALVPPGHKIPAKSVVLGLPCKQVRMATDEDLELIKNTQKNYEELAQRYLKLRGNRI
ncbi:MAG: gamma carbonic anhydrase family protein [Candidatus Methanoperedens sp.]|nr:gamma carbonic anhydrase family protein [Candidatus Methanoperedens sp.]